ncbi:MAG: amino acid adenylation domain-containing protein [Chloroflexota bacterium]
MIIDTIFNRAAESPTSLAVQCENEVITYSELLTRAKKLASHLHGLGAGRGSFIGICLPRSVDMVVGMLAAMISGGAYVPLDPSYPKDRIGFMLEDAGVRFVITQNSLTSLFPPQHIQIVCLDRDAREIAAASPDLSIEVLPPDSLAYVLYTSGSTGKPKGVMVSHESLGNFVRISQSALDVVRTDVYLQTASINYALSVRQLMVPLACGARIVVATEEQARDPLMLFDLIKCREATLMDVVPSFWRTCINRLLALPPEEQRLLLDNNIRRIVSVGEPLLFDIPLDWRNKLGHQARLVNIFGQTETTGVVAVYSIPPDQTADRAAVVPIGCEVTDTQLYILDAALKPVSPGEIGELCVSSPCLALGYLNRPELTAEKFIPNPFNDGISDRLYRTGDFARRRADGVIEFLGRGDNQVKIRGQRLELGEVEAVIRAYKHVQDCVVVAKGRSSDERFLSAYIVAAETMSGREVADFMRTQVPDHMIPIEFNFLDALPLTPNGKIDRLALQELNAPPKSNPEPIPNEQPRNDIEGKLVKMWKVLLNRPAIGIHDKFFDLGGHSFLAVRLFAKIEEEFGVRLPITTLYHAATIAELAETIKQGGHPALAWNPLVPIRTQGSKPPFFGIHGHEGGVLFWSSLLEFWPEDQPFYALQAQGVDGIRPALKKFEDMAELYIREIRKVQPSGPYYLGGYSMGGEIALEIGQQLLRQGEQVNLLVMFDTKFLSHRSNSVSSFSTLPSEVESRRSPSRLNILRHKGVGHARRLAKLSGRQKLEYILHDLSYRIERFLVFTLVEVFRFAGKRLPDKLLLNYLRKSHTQALHAYSPQWYPGRVTLFRASETLSSEPEDPSVGWHSLAGGGIDVYHFNATHNLLHPQFAPEVASRLIECLTQAQNSR